MLQIVGDVNFSDGFFDTGIGTASKIRKGKDPFVNIERSQNDIWIGNFECVCTSVTNKEGISSKQFIIEPDSLQHIKHLDVYSVANNHVMQHGESAYSEMLTNIEKLGSIYVGSKERRTIIFKHQGKNVAITSFSQRPENFSKDVKYWLLPNYKDIEQEYLCNAESADFKIAYVHWGNEFMNRPYNDQKQFAHWLIDLGYDCVVGVHPHILQGYEVYKGKHIYYSLGNFVFYMAWYKTKYSAIVSIDLSGEHPEYNYKYVRIEDNFAPKVVADSEVPEDCRFDYLNSLINKGDENEQYYSELFKNMGKYRKSNYKMILKSIPKMKGSVVKDILLSFLKRRIK